MRLNRFIISELDFPSNIFEVRDKEIIHQVSRVLRLRPGQKLIFSNGKLKDALVEILKVNNNCLRVKVLEIKENLNEPLREVFLYCSILKKKNFDLVVQKVTEIGIKEITPLICRRTVKVNIKRERLNKIIKEAAEQSGRGILPVLNEKLPFPKAVKQALAKNGLNCLFDQNGKSFQSENSVPKKIGIFIGPEGGWTKDEIELAEKNNFKIVSLGNLTFRTETAAIIASYLCLYL